MDYQDVLTFKEETIKMIEPETVELINNSRYNPIIVALREGPMTVRDLEEAYNRIITENIDKLDLPQKERKELIEKSRRKGKTLYKYLDVLVKKDIVTEAGKRIKKGQTATETLYGRTAKLFVMSDIFKGKRLEFKEEVWIKIGNIISSMRNQETVDANCLKKAIHKINEDLSKTKDKIFTRFSEELVDIMEDIGYNDLNYIAGIIELFYTISAVPEIEKELKKCFK